MNDVLFVTNVKFSNYLYIDVYLLSILFNFYTSIYLFPLLMYFNYFIHLFSSEILAILLNSKLNKVFD